MRYWDYFPPYVPVSEKKARAAKSLEKMKKINPAIKPVVVEGRTIAKTWWGKAWNRNLEAYADYSNRIGRGSAYVRHGAVLDLQIAEGSVKALVQGSQAKPYVVEIKIKRLGKDAHNDICRACGERIESMEALLAGHFPKELEEIFTAKGKGLFPSPKEIVFSCSCPDWASMCKHVAAALYGVGARLDSEPHIFFLLRKIDVETLISKTVTEQAQKLTSRAEKKSARVIEDRDISAVFGIEMEEISETDISKAGKRSSKAATAGRKKRGLPKKKGKDKHLSALSGKPLKAAASSSKKGLKARSRTAKGGQGPASASKVESATARDVTKAKRRPEK
jgi:uncharacterized Zn finger protein